MKCAIHLIVIWFSSLFIGVFNQHVEKQDAPYVVCYYGFNRTLIDLPFNLCTHINIGFFNVDKNSSLAISYENRMLLYQIMLKRQGTSANCKILITLGGSDAAPLDNMVSTHANRKKFIRDVMKYMKKYKLDGLDIDWEWPVIEGGQKEKVKFVQLLEELRKEFDLHKKKYFLSVAVAAVQSLIDTCYYPQYLAQYVDYVNVMSYDYHLFTNILPYTDYNAPLFSSPDVEAGFFRTLNINFTVNYWLSVGMPASKIVIGLPFYAHTYSLRSSQNHGRHAPASGFGFGWQLNGFASYLEVCSFLSKPTTTAARDLKAQVPYAYDSQYWASYDDPKSLQQKVQLAQKYKLRGVMIYSLNDDDFTGSCILSKNQSFPLLRSVNSEVRS